MPGGNFPSSLVGHPIPPPRLSRRATLLISRTGNSASGQRISSLPRQEGRVGDRRGGTFGRADRSVTEGVTVGGVLPGAAGDATDGTTLTRCRAAVCPLCSTTELITIFKVSGPCGWTSSRPGRNQVSRLRPGPPARASAIADAFPIPETLTDPDRLAEVAAHRPDRRARSGGEGHLRGTLKAIFDLLVSKYLHELEPRYGIKP